MVDGFDWTNADEIVVRAQRAVAVYRDADGDVVIRQACGLDWAQDDTITLLSRDAVDCLIVKLQALLDQEEAGE